MAIDRAVVADAEFVENDAWREEVFQRGLGFVCELAGGFSTNPFQELRGVFMQVREGGVRDDAVEVVRHGADIFRDRPLVVIENDDEAFRRGCDIVERFKSNAASERCVACHADDMLVGAEAVAGSGHAERGGKGGAGVTRAVAVVLALTAEQETIQALVLANRGKAVETAGEELVDIALVADIEEKLVARRVEHTVQGDREFHDTEVRAEVTAGFGEDLDEFATNLAGELGEGFGRKGLEVGGGLDGGQERAGI